jgi:hypothetical protein
MRLPTKAAGKPIAKEPWAGNRNFHHPWLFGCGGMLCFMEFVTAFMRFVTAKARQEIERRNLLWASAELPLVSTAKECRRLLLVAQEQDYERFLAGNVELRERVSGHVLAAMRRERQNPSWVPSGMANGGSELGLRVNRIMRWMWRRSGKA